MNLSSYKKIAIRIFISGIACILVLYILDCSLLIHSAPACITQKKK